VRECSSILCIVSGIVCEIVETGPLVYLRDTLVHATVYARTLLRSEVGGGGGGGGGGGLVMAGSVVGYKDARGVGK